MGAQMRAAFRQVAASSLKGVLWLALSTIVMMPPVFAQTQDGVETWVEYRKQVEGAEHIAPLDEGLSGENVSLYDGATTFSVVDIAVPGNSTLPVQLLRRLSIELQVQSVNNSDTSLRGAGNWDVDVPYMTATYPVTPSNPATDGWPAQRCSGTSLPPPTFGPSNTFWRSDAWS